jgi:hypothetical protein
MEKVLAISTTDTERHTLVRTQELEREDSQSSNAARSRSRSSAKV